MKKAQLKRLLAGTMSAVMTISAIPIVSVNAQESTEPYPYAMFAASSAEGAITINAGNFGINGNVSTNGTIESEGNVNINGTRTENADEDMIYIFDKIDAEYFSGNNIEAYTEDYTLEEMNININNPLEVAGETVLTGNININTAVKAFENITLNGEVKNTNNSVIFSKYGDIVIDSSNVNLNGLVYAPFGKVEITAQNLNLNNVVIIADSIIFNCPSVNANYSNSVAEFAGCVSEPLNIPYEEWQYMKDENENNFPDFFEDFNNWSKLNDIDGDRLPDCVELYLGSNLEMKDTDGDGLDDYYEVFVTYTDPVKPDSDDNGVNDGDEDFDEDGLTNLEEYTVSTNPWNDDSDDDKLKDGEEINTYGTDPLKKDTDDDGLEDNDEIYFGTDPTNPDTDGNGILDGDEKYSQTFTHIVENEECAVEEVIVSMEGTGNIQKNTSVESVMDEDVICSDVVGLIGEPFEIESESQFDKATVTFKINQSKLGDTELDNLLFLWYDEENYKFVELETSYDYDNSTVSIETSHFSRYMVVDKNKWFEAWAVEFNYNPNNKDSHAPTYRYNTVLAVDCSGSMIDNDPISTVSDIDSPYEATFSKTCQRIKAAENFVNNMNNVDKAAVVLFAGGADIAADMTDDSQTLKLALQKITSSGDTSFNAAISTSISAFDSSEFHGTDIINRIILLSDGGSSVSESILNNARDAGIEIYTIGLGSSSNDSVLKHISDYTGGEFFKAYTSDDLVDIYSKVGFSDFDTTDTDGDKLYDAVEAAGIRIQNGQIITGCDPTKKDTDNDGLEDGQEIDPTIRWEQKIGPELISQPFRQYYFVMKSDPVTDEDTDNDGYSDIEDPDPLNTPDRLDGQYDFLDNEIYTIEAYSSSTERFLDVQGASSASGTPITMYQSNGNDNQKFKFEWCGNGYKIHPLINEDLVLTLKLGDNGIGHISVENDTDSLEQIWEVLPYRNDSKEHIYVNSYGLIIRSKVLYYGNDNLIGQPLYINYNNNNLSVSTERFDDTRFMFNNIADWTRFGSIYMQCACWTDCQTSDILRAMKNYKNNKSIGIKTENDIDADMNIDNIIKNTPEALKYSNIISKDNYNLLRAQYGGNFPKMKFAYSKMHNVCCEVMATYNALALVGEFDINYNGTITNDLDEYFKLALEFEINDLYLNNPLGGFGSDPKGIEECLKAYNHNYRVYTNVYDMDKDVSDSVPMIVSYKFYGLGVHTYFCYYDANLNKICSVNRGSGSLKIWEDDSIKECLRDHNLHIGYILQ